MRPYRYPWRVVGHLIRERDLIGQFTWREVVGRYKGSYLGLLWSVLNPLIMLIIYTYVFSVVFKSRWPGRRGDDVGGFAIALFAGLTMYNLFAEVTNAAPGLILMNTSYVKRVVFPLEILPLVSVLSGLVHAVIGLAILVVTQLCVGHPIPWTLWLCILPLATISLFSLGLAYFLASLGVFVRDVGQTVSLAVTMLFFLSPIFYPVSRMPEWAQVISEFNPIAVVVEDTRRVAIYGQMPDWYSAAGIFAFSLLMAWAGFIWFIKSKRAFADVL